MNAPVSLSPPGTLRRAQPWLGTLVGIEASGLAPTPLNRAIGRAFAAVARVHQAMSFHDADSELSRLNRLAHTGPVRVSGHLRRVLGAACRLSALTDGVFDVTVAPVLIRWRYLPRPPSLANARGNWRDIRLHVDGTVAFARPLQIDLGGIAKGYAVDLAIAALRRAGVPQACVNAGGDLRFYGREPRQIGVRDPRPSPGQPDHLRLLAPMLEGAVATSCVADTRQQGAAGWRSPLVDPRRRQAFARADSVTVLAHSCLYADALTKPVALDPAACEPVLRRLRARALVVPAA
ncbi:MAG: FAD:protein FMN transferase [Pseudomonadota bacterium]